MNKKTVALTKEQFDDIITTMKDGFTGFRPNPRVATALVIEANLGIRMSDVLQLKLNDIKKDGDRYHLEIIEKKTKKERTFTVPNAIYTYLKMYCFENHIEPDERIFPITERAVQKQLKLVCDFCEFCLCFSILLLPQCFIQSSISDWRKTSALFILWCGICLSDTQP